MFDHRHYVPILKGKLGEYGALKELSPQTASHLTPLIEIPPIEWDYEEDAPRSSVDEHVAPVVDRIQSSWGTQRRLSLDLPYLEPGVLLGNGRHPLEEVFATARTKGVQAVPVTAPDRDRAYQDAVRDTVRVDKRGLCLRVIPADFEGPGSVEDRLTWILEQMRLRPEEADLVLDLRDLLPSQAATMRLAAQALLTSIPFPSRWRTLTLAGSAFPLDLREYDTGLSRRPRTEWVIWRALLGQPGVIPRLPTFGDYAIAHPEPPDLDYRMIRMSANIRYTVDAEWLIFKGRNLRDNPYTQYHDLARDVLNHPQYAGASFSWGDDYIEKCAARQVTSGNQMTWRKVGTSHHLAFVVAQLATVAGP